VSNFLFAGQMDRQKLLSKGRDALVEDFYNTIFGDLM
jgi:hypothetical protein